VVREKRAMLVLFSLVPVLFFFHFLRVCLPGCPGSVVAGFNLEGKVAGIMASPEGIR